MRKKMKWMKVRSSIEDEGEEEDDVVGEDDPDLSG